LYTMQGAIQVLGLAMVGVDDSGLQQDSWPKSDDPVWWSVSSCLALLYTCKMNHLNCSNDAAMMTVSCNCLTALALLLAIYHTQHQIQNN